MIGLFVMLFTSLLPIHVYDSFFLSYTSISSYFLTIIRRATDIAETPYPIEITNVSSSSYIVTITLEKLEYNPKIAISISPGGMSRVLINVLFIWIDSIGIISVLFKDSLKPYKVSFG